jgi:hypothetical protein
MEGWARLEIDFCTRRRAARAKKPVAEAALLALLLSGA